MNLKEKCELEGITLKEGKAKYGLTHWKQEVVTDEPSEKPLEEIVDVAIEAVKDVVDIVEDNPEGVALDLIELSIRGIGHKSPYWHLRHLIGRK